MTDARSLTNAARDLSRVYAKQAAQAERTRAERNQTIIDAVMAGATQADIAKATGLTSGRINQIVKGAQQSE